MLVLELARSDYVERRENIIAVGNSGTGKSHVALGLGLAACQKGLSVAFITASALVHELLEARDEKRLLRLQRQLSAHKRKHPAKAAGEDGRAQAAASTFAGRSALQFHGSRSVMRLAGWSAMRARTSASQARASTSLSLQVSIRV